VFPHPPLKQGGNAERGPPTYRSSLKDIDIAGLWGLPAIGPANSAALHTTPNAMNIGEPLFRAARKMERFARSPALTLNNSVQCFDAQVSCL
jgi:hypothetical protein